LLSLSVIVRHIRNYYIYPTKPVELMGITGDATLQVHTQQLTNTG